VNASVVVPFPSWLKCSGPSTARSRPKERTAVHGTRCNGSSVAIPVTGADGIVEIVPGRSRCRAGRSYCRPPTAHRAVRKSAQLCSAPRCEAQGRFLPTVTGRRVGGGPVPSWPSLFRPQQRTAPSWRSAQVWKIPASTRTAVVIPLTLTEAERRNDRPMPSCPSSFRPSSDGAVLEEPTGVPAAG